MTFLSVLMDFGEFLVAAPNFHQIRTNFGFFLLFSEFWRNFHDFRPRPPYSDVTRPSLFLFNPFTRVLLGFSPRGVLPLSCTISAKTVVWPQQNQKSLHSGSKFAKTIKKLKKFTKLLVFIENTSKPQNKRQKLKSAPVNAPFLRPGPKNT